MKNKLLMAAAALALGFYLWNGSKKKPAAKDPNVAQGNTGYPVEAVPLAGGSGAFESLRNAPGVMW